MKAISHRHGHRSLVDVAARITALGAALAVIAACGDDPPSTLVASASSPAGDVRYSSRDLEAGVTVHVQDRAGAVASADVFFAEPAADYGVSTADIEAADGEVVIGQDPTGDYDVFLVYRSGPYCGLLPRVTVDGDTSLIEVTVRTRDEGNCDAMEYDEAVGLRLQPDFRVAEVRARRG